MTTEELMKIRYKVIADYPGCNVPIGTTFVSDIGEYFDKFPAVFRKLGWFEERNKEDFPQYLKSMSGNSVRKIDRFEPYWDKVLFVGGAVRAIDKWLPATEEEYLAHIKNTQNGTIK